MASIFEQYGFLEFTNDNITISGKEGWKLLSISVTSVSTAAASITGKTGVTIGNKPVTSFSLGAGEELAIGTGDNAIDDITITAPSGCNVQIVAERDQNII
jgi:hypothetical protein